MVGIRKEIIVQWKLWGIYRRQVGYDVIATSPLHILAYTYPTQFFLNGTWYFKFQEVVLRCKMSLTILYVMILKQVIFEIWSFKIVIPAFALLHVYHVEVARSDLYIIINLKKTDFVHASVCYNPTVSVSHRRI